MRKRIGFLGVLATSLIILSPLSASAESDSHVISTNELVFVWT